MTALCHQPLPWEIFPSCLLCQHTEPCFQFQPEESKSKESGSAGSTQAGDSCDVGAGMEPALPPTSTQAPKSCLCTQKTHTHKNAAGTQGRPEAGQNWEEGALRCSECGGPTNPACLQLVASCLEHSCQEGGDSIIQGRADSPLSTRSCSSPRAPCPSQGLRGHTRG